MANDGQADNLEFENNDGDYLIYLRLIHFETIMFGTYFYHETIKRCVSVFGTLFNNLDYKKTKEDGTVLGRYKVPISYGPHKSIYRD